MINDWTKERVLLTGGAGFLGRYVQSILINRGCLQISVPRRSQYNLCDREAIKTLLTNFRPTTVLHLAAVVGGIGANRSNPGLFFYENAVMGIELMEQARQAGVNKFICIGTICAYPKFTVTPFTEDDLWNGYPEETNAPYGLAKKMLLVQAQAYRQQYGFNAIYLLPVNLYGPGDNFDLRQSHVIPALIRKFVEAQMSGESFITAWGSGRVSREFLYVADAAEAIILAAEKYDKSEPVNLGSGVEITIRELALLIKHLVGFTGDVRWDEGQPDGQPRRCLNTTRAQQEFGFTAKTGLVVGLERTIEWYRRTQFLESNDRAECTHDQRGLP